MSACITWEGESMYPVKKACLLFLADA